MRHNKSVWICRVNHRHGTDIALATSEEIARQHLAEYCREWWEFELGKGLPNMNDQAVVAAYFALLRGNESYDLYESEVHQ